MAPYQYMPLGESELRLVHILPGSFDNDIAMRIVHVPFSSTKRPGYEALSYTWGSEDDPKTICITPALRKTGFMERFMHKRNRTRLENGDTKVRTLSVTPNLEQALRHLRLAKEPRILWIDAICINQQDLQERNNEVSRMGDIYSNASQVVVWLGPKSVDSELSMNTLSQLSQHLKPLDTSSNLYYRITNPNNPYLFRGDSEEILLARRNAVSSFFRRAWFNRLWIWQELILAVKVVIVCGNSMVPYPDFKQATLMILGHLPGGEPMHECLADGTGQAVFRLLSLGRISPPLTSLIDYTKFALCKDPRDRVFALRNLLPVDMQLEMKVDYNSTPERVYEHACLSSIKLCQSLEILTFCEMPYPPTWESSWVPNLSAPKRTQSISYGQTSGVSIPEIRFTEDHKLLVEAVNVTSIQYCSSAIPFEADLKEIIERIREWASDYLSLFASEEEKLEAAKNFVCAILCRQVTIEDVDHKDSLSLEDSFQGFATVMAIDPDTVSREQLLQLPFVTAALSMLPGRAIFWTRENAIGLGPGVMETGNRIYALLGCNVPLIIRPTSDALDEGRIVGACFVTGLMNAEAFLGPLPPSIKYWCSILEGRPRMMYSNDSDSQASEEDPRLGPLPFGWELYEQTVYPLGFDDFPARYLINMNEIVRRHLIKLPNDFNGDPRLSSTALKTKGANIITLTLV